MKKWVKKRLVYKDQKLDEVKVFKDPVHRYVRVSDRVIWDLIGTPEFQRLRRIKQLGTTFLTFHGAEHSRFNHSLGVYEIVRRIIDKFESYTEWPEEERLLCLCAALLHDLGHGPFSHSFEKVFSLDHEKITKAIILGDTAVNRILEKVEQGFAAKVASVIDKSYDDKLIVSLISSQTDADRMDYLLRDAYYTGVSYGHFDLDRILRVMRPTKDQVVIKSTGMHAIEDYIMCRYQMYWQVYFHPVTRSAEVILTKILDRAKYLYETDYVFSLEPTHFISFFHEDHEINIHDYFKLDESVVLYYFQLWQDEQDPILSDLSHRFVNRNLFKYIEINPVEEMDKYEQLRELFKEAQIDPDYYLAIDSSSDLPYDFYQSEEKERMPIFLMMPNGDFKELSTHSEVVEAISRKRRTDHKLYFPLDFIEQISQPELQRKILDLLSYQMYEEERFDEI